MEERRTLAGFALSAALFALAIPQPPPHLRPCQNPVEAAARDGQTTEVVCIAAGKMGAEVRGPARRLFGLPIDLNCAQARTLETFPGLGPVRAQSIVEARQVQPFERVEDLLRVHGIGPKTLERLRGGLTVASASAERTGRQGSIHFDARKTPSRLGAGHSWDRPSAPATGVGEGPLLSPLDVAAGPSPTPAAGFEEHESASHPSRLVNHPAVRELEVAAPTCTTEPQSAGGAAGSDIKRA
jgi:competence ComEA-like helix-hairpin-helix protein